MRRQRGRRGSYNRRQPLSADSLVWVLIASFACAIPACRKQTLPPPGNVYQEIRHTFQIGDLDLALKRVDQASLQYSEQSMEWSWRFRVLKAQILVPRGSYRDSLRLLDEEPPTSLAGTDVVVRRAMVRGLALEFSGQLDQAEQSLRIAEQLAATNHPQLLGDIAQARGILFMIRGSYEAARSAFRGAIQVAREQNQPFLEANALGSLGNVSMRQEHYDEAVEWYRAAYQLSLNLGTRYSLTKTLGNMGWSYFALGDFEKALALFDQAESASVQTGLIQDQILWLISIGNVYLSQHQAAVAENTFQRALELARRYDDKAATTDCLNKLSLVALEKGHLDQAEKYSREALALLPDDTGLKLTRGHIEAQKRNFRQARKLFAEVIKDQGVESSLRWEAQARLAGLFADEGFPARAEAEFRRSLRTVDAVRSSVQSPELRVSFLSSGIEFYDDYINFLISKGRTMDALAVAELSRARTLAEGLGAGTARPTLLKGFDPPAAARRRQATILSYWLGPKRSLLWVIPPTGRTELFTLPPARDIESLVQSYREALVGPRDVLETSNPAGAKLYEILVAPAQKWLPRDRRVVILPDGALYRLNFEALLVPGPEPHYWIEDVTIANASSLSLLQAASRAKPAGPARMWLIGDPVSSSGEFPRLPQAEREMEDIQKHFRKGQVAVMSGQHATAAAYLDGNPENYSYIHFVAHGTASRTSPLDSAIILTKQGDSAKLYARDIIQKPLRANLVTISACNGAGVRTYAGEGLVGLAWAFLRAGAHSVIAGLWEVSDASTPQLMDTLYGELRKGRDPASALRAAKLALLHSQSVYRKPFYWAPFQLYAGS